MKTKFVINKIFDIYLFLFLFLTINREFKLFSFDIRFFILILGFLLCIAKLRIRNFNKITKLELSLIIFYLLLFTSVLNFAFNDYLISIKETLNQFILHFNNFLLLFVCYLYKDLVLKRKVIFILFLSIFILFLSQVLVALDVNIELFTNKEFVGYYTGPEHINLLGQNFRYAGFAYDPNYASFFFTILLFIYIYEGKENLFIRLLGIIIACSGIVLSFSRTIFIAFIIASIFYFLVKYFEKVINKKNFNIFYNISIILLPLIIFTFVILLSMFPYKSGLDTMNTRFNMWQNAKNLFLINPLLGNGLTSFRGFFDLNGGWYVQCHSTYWQILSEMGLIGAVSFSYVIYNCFKFRNKIYNSLVIMFLIFGFTSELTYLQIFVVVIYIFYIMYEKDSIRSNSALFFVNSFGQGGAERVCVNLAEGLMKLNYKVLFITIYPDQKYDISSDFDVYCLNLDKDLGKLKKVFSIVIASIKLEFMLYNYNLKHGNFSLITSHLPMSNLLSLISSTSKECIYVMHTLCSVYSKGKDFLFSIFLKIVFFKRKIVCVSNGVSEELIRRYKMNKKFIKTIYNPIDIDVINRKKEESVDVDYKYFLFVGRLNKVKRIDRLLKIYEKGDFRNKYKLILIGDGEDREILISYVNEKKLENDVVFVGWQDNVYKWMKNAELLFLVSDYEAFPMVLIEALSCGCKVIASDYGDYGPKEILIEDFSNYLINDIDNIDKYIEKIREIGENYPKPESNKVLQLCYIDKCLEQYFDTFNSNNNLKK